MLKKHHSHVLGYKEYILTTAVIIAALVVSSGMIGYAIGTIIWIQCTVGGLLW